MVGACVRCYSGKCLDWIEVLSSLKIWSQAVLEVVREDEVGCYISLQESWTSYYYLFGDLAPSWHFMLLRICMYVHIQMKWDWRGMHMYVLELFQSWYKFTYIWLAWLYGKLNLRLFSLLHFQVLNIWNKVGHQYLL